MKLEPRLRNIAVALLCAALGACAAPNHPGHAAMAHDTPAAKPDTTTFCLGRFLIDLPAGSKLSGGNYKYDFAQVEKPKAMSLEEFEKEVGERIATLKATKHEKDPNLLRLLQQPDQATRVLAFWEREYSEFQVQIEGYRWINGLRLFMKDRADTGKQGFALDRMKQSLSRIRPRTDTEIPTEPGYCFEGGFIANEEWENEEVNVDIDIAGHPDAFVTVWFFPLASHKRDKPLLERMGGAVQQLGRFATGVHVLRKGEREVAGFKGQEYLSTVPNSGGFRGHYFVWETQGEGTLQEPQVTIELTTGHQDPKGNPQRTRLSDEQAMRLWDDVLKSFRVRPTGGGPKTSEAAPPKAPLGELVATGRDCPQTGWWQCADAGEVQGGRRQYFRAGERMPHAVLPGEPSVWQKLKGERSSHKTATVWQLVDYGEPPAAPTPPAEAPSSADSTPSANEEA